MSRFFFVIIFCIVAFSAVTSFQPVYGQADYKRFYDEDKLPKVREIFQLGRYDIVLQICDYALSRGQPSWEWRSLRMNSLAALGSYEEAVEEASAIAKAFPVELGALLEVHDLFKRTGKKEELESVLGQLNVAAGKVPKNDRNGLDLVRLGKAALILGADPSEVIQNYFVPAKANKAKGKSIPPGLVEAHQASGELALEKNDYQLAATEFRAALKFEPDNPDLRFGLALAYLPNDRKAGMKYLDQVFGDSEIHIEALLLKAEHQINFEQYQIAEEYLRVIQEINPRLPEAHAYRAIIANLEKNDSVVFQKERKLALQIWPTDPSIDHLIGRVLSRNYRFQEGADAQLRAIAFDPDYLPAKLQLALDYLRLGHEEKTWPLAAEVGAADTYDVLAYNLEILKKEIASFATIKTPDFIIRMPKNEAELYGDRALEILTEAKQLLGKKYGLKLDHPVLVEFFPNQSDFAIRSFGSLGGAGLLGVCFGTVITMNSPGSLTNGKNNWEATLWHELCHVITLTATKNKMPRWLSEGISVYEEMQRNPNWGQRMTITYRKMIIVAGELTPIEDLSQAFYKAKTGKHTMFAYYESMLVVKYIVDHFGMDALRGILKDLATGMPINDSIAKNTIPLKKLEEGFAAHVTDLAENLSPGVDWTKPDPEALDPADPVEVEAFSKKNPTNFWAKKRFAENLLNKKSWERAIVAAEELIKLYPDYVETGSGYELQAQAYRGVGKPEKEAEVLERLAAKSSEAYQAYSRLLAVNFEKEKWPEVTKNADRVMAINPFQKEIHYCSGCAHQAMKDSSAAITSFEKSLNLNPTNPSEVRFRLAKLLRPRDQLRSKRYLLDSLADSPRFREAHAFLLKVEEPDKPSPEATPLNGQKAK